MAAQVNDSHDPSTHSMTAYALRSAAYDLGHVSRTVRIWQTFYFDNRTGEDCTPVIRDRMASAIHTLQPIVPGNLSASVEKTLDAMEEVNAQVKAIRDGSVAHEEGDRQRLEESSDAAAASLCALVTAEVVDHWLLKEWFRLGCALGTFTTMVQHGLQGPVPSMRPVVLAARRLVDLDRGVPASIRVIAAENRRGTAETALATLRAALENTPHAIHNQLPLDTFYAAFDLGREIRDTLEWLPLETPDENQHAKPRSPSGSEFGASGGMVPIGRGVEIPSSSHSADDSPGHVHEQAEQVAEAGSERWFHRADESRPSEYQFGPLEGTKKDLASAVFGGGHRNLQRPDPARRFWIVRLQHKLFEIWFKDETRFLAAQKKLSELHTGIVASNDATELAEK